ncbi:hypothetical protein DEO72_LG10g2117 [Vigna unguiculata]|uniref:Uncharacterized protein n=1 Tax=Vigna unguiculata TaxID=3917 RepID=A0A4D6NFC8_VIGUN|nr:hypothetical protein DEO72_LG10g2117 [Vigna unguiculata]
MLEGWKDGEKRSAGKDFLEWEQGLKHWGRERIIESALRARKPVVFVNFGFLPKNRLADRRQAMQPLFMIFLGYMINCLAARKDHQAA